MAPDCRKNNPTKNLKKIVRVKEFNGAIDHGKNNPTNNIKKNGSS
jgi:hypothetical protein